MTNAKSNPSIDAQSEDLTPYDRLTPAMRTVVDALAEGIEPSPSVLAALSTSEVQEARLLARTARLTYLSLHQPPIGADVEAEALSRAQTALSQRPKLPAKAMAQGGLMNFFRRLRGGSAPSTPTEGEEETR